MGHLAKELRRKTLSVLLLQTNVVSANIYGEKKISWDG